MWQGVGGGTQMGNIYRERVTKYYNCIDNITQETKHYTQKFPLNHEIYILIQRGYFINNNMIHISMNFSYINV